ncbi:MAG: ComEC/Rec2 family competence protein [Armatimonadota bacterium]|nr:ComEC/Rec2 family competence protein [Armatimonadota bacterium]
MPDIVSQTSGALSPLKRPLFMPAAAFALGIVAAEYVRAPAGSVVALGVISVVLLLRKPRPAWFLVIVLTAVFFSGFARYQNYTRIDPSDVSLAAPDHYVTAVGVVTSDPEIRERSTRLTVRVSRVRMGRNWRTVSGNLLVSLYGSSHALRTNLPNYGDSVRFSGWATLPPEPTNPGVFSYRSYLARQGVHTVLYLRRSGRIETLRHGSNCSVTAVAARARRSVSASLERLMPKRYAGIAEGMALGTYATLPDDAFENFSRTGTLHLLAASGFNCAVIMVCALYLFRALRLQKRWAYAAAVPAVIFYMLVVGAKPSIVRAAIMAGLLAGAYILRRVSDPLNALFAAALVILAIRPTDIFDVGFQLSFAAVAAIVLLIPTLQRWMDLLFSPPAPPPRRSKIDTVARWLARRTTEAVAATIAATLGTAPITAHYFNQVSLVSIPANAAVALLAPPIFVLSLFAPAVAVIPWLGQAVGTVDAFLIRLMLLAVNGLGSPSWSCLPVSSPGLLGSAGYYLIAGCVFVYASRKTYAAS